MSTTALVDYFLQVDGVNGESPDAQYPGLIQVLSWGWGEENQGHWGFGSGGGSGKVEMKDFHFRMYTNKASPKLFTLCATGEHIPRARLICRKSGQGQQDFLTVIFTNILVSSFHTSGSNALSGATAMNENGLNGNAKSVSDHSSILPIDEINLNFARIEMEYKEQQADGTMGAVIKSGYDLKLNQRV